MQIKELIIPISVYSEADLTEEYRQLIVRAKAVSEEAYAIYSKFKVGAAILLENGEIIAANNQENAAYPSGLCAERVTMLYANAVFPDVAPKIIAVAAQNASGFLGDPIPPCGACRQVLVESENRYGRDIEVLLYGTKAIYRFASVHDLLPLAFGHDDLAR